MSKLNSNLKRLERILLVVGLALVASSAYLYIGGRIHARDAVARFRANHTPSDQSAHGSLASVTQVDYSLWSPKRIEQYKASLAGNFDPPIALLRVEKIRLEVPVFEGTSDEVLNRGVGRIEATAHIGAEGNVGIAGHRDGFFRGLKDVSVGDKLELDTAGGTQIYMIDSIKLVGKNDVSVLENGPEPALTLVTCFPFYFVGSAPQRYIVHASLQGETKILNESAKASSQATASRSKENTQ